MHSAWGSWLALAMTLVPGTTLAAELYVSLTGDDSADCSSATPCRTIQHAVDVAFPGDVIRVGVGDFAPVAITKDLTLEGAGPTVTRVDAQGTSTTPLDVRDAAVTVRRMGFVNGNVASNAGGAFLRSSSVVLEDCHVVGNHVDGVAGGVHASSTDLTVRNCVIAANTAGDTPNSGAGGAIVVTNATLIVEGSTVRDNVVGASGGGIECISGTVTVTDSTVSGNLSISGLGGGIYARNCDTTVVNTTLSGNTSELYGGGIYKSSGSLTLIHATVTGNTSVRGEGGGLFGSATIEHTLLAHNVAAVGPDCRGALSSNGYNLLGDVTSCVVTGDLTGNLVGIDPMLDVLANYGGMTDTHALLATSAAIDGGNPVGCNDHLGAPLLRDQRGEVRPFGPTCDIGAFEVSSCVDIIPPDQGNTVLAARQGDDVHLSFPAAPASRWRVYRDVTKLSIGVTPLAPDVTTPLFVDPSAVLPGAGMELFYALRGLSPCTSTPGP